VFAPDFSRTGPDPGQPDPGRLEAAGIVRTAAAGAAQPRSWYEIGTAGKGPVRGYPPAPGQPLPLYPPGQFAAWNRHRDALAGRGGPGGPEVSPTPGDDLAPPQAVTLAPGGESGTSASGPLSRYYARDSDPGLDPGYPTLAVSDPAADVTSTQTWRALADGRATGIWTAPAGLRQGAAGPVPPAAPPGSPAGPLAERAAGQPVRPRAGLPAQPGTSRPARSGGHAAVSRPRGIAAGDADATAADPSSSAGADPRSGARRVSSRHSGAHTGAHTGPQPGVAQERPVPGDRAGKDQASRGPLAGQGRGRASERGRRLRRGRPASVHVAIAAASLLILAAAGTLAYTALHDSAKPRPVPQSSGKKATSASPSPSLGAYGLIASRQTDPQPLTLAELYPASFVLAGNTVTIVAATMTSTCSAALVGSTLQSAIGAASCTQVARATYVDQSGVMGTIGVLNLSSGDAAKTAAQSADASDYISQLAGPTGPAHSIGQGTGIEEAAAKGHYLILIWAELTSEATPSAQQTAVIEGFMTGLLQNTVNHDLTTRMLTGAP